MWNQIYKPNKIAIIILINSSQPIMSMTKQIVPTRKKGTLELFTVPLIKGKVKKSRNVLKVYILFKIFFTFCGAKFFIYMFIKFFYCS